MRTDSLTDSAHQAMPQSGSSLPEFSLKYLLANRIKHFFRRNRLCVVGDMQQVSVPFVFDQLNTIKPYQGLFDPIGSVGAQQLQLLFHTFHIDCDLDWASGLCIYICRRSTAAHDKRG